MFTFFNWKGWLALEGWFYLAVHPVCWMYLCYFVYSATEQKGAWIECSWKLIFQALSVPIASERCFDVSTTNFKVIFSQIFDTSRRVLRWRCSLLLPLSAKNIRKKHAIVMDRVFEIKRNYFKYKATWTFVICRTIFYIRVCIIY